MNQQTLTAANQAIFQLQLNTDDAIQYVIDHSGVSFKDAKQALNQVMTGYKIK